MQWFIRPKIIGARQVLAFQDSYPDLSDAAVALVERLRELLSWLSALVTEQEVHQEGAREAMQERNRAERLLRGLVAQVALMFRVLAKQEGVVPPATVSVRDRGARAFVRGVERAIAAAAEHQERLLHYGMPAGLLFELDERFAQYAGAEALREWRLTEALKASAAMEEAGEEVSLVIFNLDALNRIRFAGYPELLAAWRAARYPTAAVSRPPHGHPASADLDSHPVANQ